MNTERLEASKNLSHLNIIDDLLSINPFSRSGAPLDTVMALVIHYIGVGGQRAKVARNYWEGLKTQDARDAIPDRSASAHFIVDLDGSIVRTVPETEKAYHCGAAVYTPQARSFFGPYCTDSTSSPNRVTIGIEMTHPNATGKPTVETFESTRQLVRALCEEYRLDPFSRIWRHYDVTGKDCPRWLVAQPKHWRWFLESI